MGDDQVPKVLRHFLPKYWENIWILGLNKSYLTVVQNRPIQKLPHGCPKWGGGSRPLLDNVQKKDAFFMVSLSLIKIWDIFKVWISGRSSWLLLTDSPPGSGMALASIIGRAFIFCVLELEISLPEAGRPFWLGRFGGTGNDGHSGLKTGCSSSGRFPIAPIKSFYSSLRANEYGWKHQGSPSRSPS